jgi:plastocyanin
MKNLIFTATSIIITLLFITSFSSAGTITGIVEAKGVKTDENEDGFIGVNHVMIYIEKVGENKFAPPEEAAAMDQKEMTFIPHVMPILVGTKVDFLNSDAVLHNVFSPSKTKEFNLGTYAAGVVKSVVFDEPGLVAILCNVHPEMSAFVLPLKTPYFAVTDEDGKFQIPNDKAMKIAKVAEKYKKLPAGKYKLITWHEKLKTATQEIVVPDEGEVKVEFALIRGKSKIPYQDERKK